LEWMPHLKPHRSLFIERLLQLFSRWFSNPNAKQGPSWNCVEIAWWALGSDGRSAIPTLARIMNQPRRNMDDYSVWTESAKAISYLGPDAIIPMLTVATNMHGQHELWELLHNFQKLGTNGAPAVPALIHWAHDPDYWVRDGVVSALGGIGKRPDLAVPILLTRLHDSDSMVRRDAAAALGVFANDSEAVLPQLIKTLKDSDWEARGGALTGLGKIGNKPETVVPFIVPYLFDDNSVIQRSAAYALRDLGSEAGFNALLQASNAPNIGDIVYEVAKRPVWNNRNRYTTVEGEPDCLHRCSYAYGASWSRANAANFANGRERPDAMPSHSARPFGDLTRDDILDNITLT